MAPSRAALTAGLALVASLLLPSAPSRGGIDAESVFLRAKQTWRGRAEARFVSYAVRSSYGFHNHTIENWFQLTYRATDGALAIRPIVLPDEARRKEGGVPLYLFGLKIFDTNPDADAIDVRAPAIEPAFTFGLLPRSFLPTVPAAPDDPTPEPEQERMREIGRVIAVNLEYAVTFVGEEHLRYGDALHLALQPLRDPHLNRLRDIWVAKDSYLLLRERVAGLFEIEPYDRIDWVVRFVPLDGRMYIQQIEAEKDMEFGIERIRHMQLDFVDYHFPSDVPDYVFEPDTL
jgi:hypothetical protein